MLKDVVSETGSWRVKVGKVYCSVGTPLLRVHDVAEGDRLKITLSFYGRSKKEGRRAGAHFKLDATGPVQPITRMQGMFEGQTGWQSYSLIGFYEVGRSPDAPADDVTFDVLFGNGAKGGPCTMDGRGRIRDFLLSAEVV